MFLSFLQETNSRVSFASDSFEMFKAMAMSDLEAAHMNLMAFICPWKGL